MPLETGDAGVNPEPDPDAPPVADPITPPEEQPEIVNEEER
jgi:hypothetical protein